MVQHAGLWQQCKSPEVVLPEQREVNLYEERSHEVSS